MRLGGGGETCIPVRGLEAPAGLALVRAQPEGPGPYHEHAGPTTQEQESSPKEEKGQREARAASVATDAQALPAEPRRLQGHLSREPPPGGEGEQQPLSDPNPLNREPAPLLDPALPVQTAKGRLGQAAILGAEALARPHSHLLQELEAWTMDFTLPTTVWLAGFFNPQSFLTAVMQSMARKNEWPLDKMCLSVEVTKKNREDMTAPPREGSYVYGLFMEGNRHWQGKHQGHVGSQWPEEPNHTPASAWPCCGAGPSADLSPHFEAVRSSALEPRTGIRSGGEGPGAHLCQGYCPTTAPPARHRFKGREVRPAPSPEPSPVRGHHMARSQQRGAGAAQGWHSFSSTHVTPVPHRARSDRTGQQTHSELSASDSPTPLSD